MLTDAEISERNNLLLGFIASLDLGIHVLDLPHKPKLISSKYHYWFNGYVKNYHLILTTAEFNGKDFLKIHLKTLQKMDPKKVKEKIQYWIQEFKHKRIYTIRNGDKFLIAFHAQDLNPVFGHFHPLIYYSRERAESIVRLFPDHKLTIN